jgi:3-deoxy-D-manno-octulosonic-acid transferase
MALSPNSKARLRRLAGHALARWVRLVANSSKAVYEPADAVSRIEAAHPAILAFWHGQFVTIPALAPRTVPTRIMVARHGDADVIGHALERFPHLGLIRGAGAGGRRKDRGGAAALRTAVRALEEGFSLALTADVPPGPARRASPGIVTLARLSGRPIIPVAIASSRYASFATWSRMTLNLPFSRLGIVVGEPIEVARDADEAAQQQARAALEAALQQVTARAYALAGADPSRATPEVAVADDPGGPPAAAGLRLKAYRSATTLLRPVLPLVLRYRERQGKEDAARLDERLGVASRPRPAGPLVWVHAASVGEANAVLPLIEALGRRRQMPSCLLTTGTVTSAALAARRLGTLAIHQFVPLDSPAYVRRFLDHWRPDVAVLTESEIWPNIVLEASARSVPLVLVNARMSGRSYGRWRRARGLARPIFNRIDLVLAQNEKLARRYGELGARRSIAVGNLKIDAPPPPVDRAELARLQQALAGRPLLIAASTHEGEEVILAAAHRIVRQQVPGFCTIVVPRHPERGVAIAEAMKGMGLSSLQRSQGALPAADMDIYIADTLGELGTFYALSPIAFVGGSLVPHGGQNPIEAVRHDAVVLTGPHRENFADAYSALFRHAGAIEVRSAEDISTAVVRLAASEAERARMRAGASVALAALSGALERTLEALDPYLPAEDEFDHAS